jgi:hypothetical protein
MQKKGKKRGRKSKKELAELAELAKLNPPDDIEEIPKVHKKRGRKPKGGKIIEKVKDTKNNLIIKPNIILHLKCSKKDIEIINEGDSDVSYIPFVQNIENFNIIKNTKANELGYEKITEHDTDIFKEKCLQDPKRRVKKSKDSDTEYGDNMRTIWKKIKELEINLHKNNISDKKSACFWCTCSFDNPPIFIPKHKLNDTYFVYGCFCSPECATAFLMKDNIDTATKFERYHLLNHIYCKIYNYEKNIKPAPNPHYMLDKFYGNLSIQDYRKLLKNERLLLIVDKPMTRILPELHEDNDDFVINSKSIPSANKFTLRRSNKKQTKNDIVQETFCKKI